MNLADSLNKLPVVNRVDRKDGHSVYVEINEQTKQVLSKIGVPNVDDYIEFFQDCDGEVVDISPAAYHVLGIEKHVEGEGFVIISSSS